MNRELHSRVSPLSLQSSHAIYAFTKTGSKNEVHDMCFTERVKTKLVFVKQTLSLRKKYETF